jgi:hypothetical protein
MKRAANQEADPSSFVKNNAFFSQGFQGSTNDKKNNTGQGFSFPFASGQGVGINQSQKPLDKFGKNPTSYFGPNNTPGVGQTFSSGFSRPQNNPANNSFGGFGANSAGFSGNSNNTSGNSTGNSFFNFSKDSSNTPNGFRTTAVSNTTHAAEKLSPPFSNSSITKTSGSFSNTFEKSSGFQSSQPGAGFNQKNLNSGNFNGKGNSFNFQSSNPTGFGAQANNSSFQSSNLTGFGAQANNSSFQSSNPTTFGAQANNSSFQSSNFVGGSPLTNNLSNPTNQTGFGSMNPISANPVNTFSGNFNANSNNRPGNPSNSSFGSFSNQSSGKFTGIASSSGENQGFSQSKVNVSSSANTVNKIQPKPDAFQPINVDPNSICGPQDFIYTELSDLLEADKKLFESKEFLLFKIPSIPPPKELC